MVDSSRSSTAIGPSMLVRGSLQGDEDLTVLGRVEGSVELTRTLIVENGGIVKADVEVRNAVVSGIVVGNITASDSVEITETGRVVGDIKAPRVLIVDGARFRGLVDMGDLDAPRASEPLPVRTVSRPGSSTALATRQTQQRSAVPARRQPPAPPRPAAAPAARAPA
ncbi:MAG: polymer-forming cytoskeletal protein, partial [Myxococcota bacterium]